MLMSQYGGEALADWGWMDGPNILLTLTYTPRIKRMYLPHPIDLPCLTKTAKPTATHGMKLGNIGPFCKPIVREMHDDLHLPLIRSRRYHLVAVPRLVNMNTILGLGNR